MSLACEVCYESYSTKCPARVIAACGHDFCGSCIQALILQQYSKAQCPKCRAYVMEQDNGPDLARLLVRSFGKDSDNDPGGRLFASLFPISQTLSELTGRLDFGDHLPQDLARRLLAQAETASLEQELHLRQQQKDSIPHWSRPTVLGYKKSVSGHANKMSSPLALLRPLLHPSISFRPTGALDRSHADDDHIFLTRRTTITPSYGNESRKPGLGSLMLLLVLVVLTLLERVFIQYPKMIISKFPRENRTQLLAVLQGVPLLLAASCFLYRMVSSG